MEVHLWQKKVITPHHTCITFVSCMDLIQRDWMMNIVTLWYGMAPIVKLLVQGLLLWLDLSRGLRAVRSLSPISPMEHRLKSSTKCRVMAGCWNGALASLAAICRHLTIVGSISIPFLLTW